MRLVVEGAAKSVDVAVECCTDPALAAPADWVIVTTKAQDTLAIAPWLAALTAAHTRVAVLQNGVDHEARVAPLVQTPHILPVLVYFNGERLERGRMRVRFRPTNDGDLVVPAGELGVSFAELLTDSDVCVRATDDFTTLAWRKLLLNAIANPLTALTIERQHIFRRADIQALCIEILNEAIAAGRAAGAQLEPADAVRTLETLLTFPPDAGTSMYFDRVHGRSLEIEALTGAVVAAAQRYGVDAPINTALLTLLRTVNDAVPRER
ncbi:MAG: oxidoreductase [Candidatus Velthaea sp.]